MASLWGDRTVGYTHYLQLGVACSCGYMTKKRDWTPTLFASCCCLRLYYRPGCLGISALLRRTWILIFVLFLIYKKVGCESRVGGAVRERGARSILRGRLWSQLTLLLVFSCWSWLFLSRLCRQMCWLNADGFFFHGTPNVRCCYWP